MKDIALLKKTLGLPTGPSWLDRAIVHSSFINENPGSADDSNEKIEFLGDAVLGLIIAQKLYQDYPLSSEGELTRLRSALVRKETLAQMAHRLGLGDFLLLGKGEEAGGGREKTLNLAGAFEAVVGAVYLDFGLEKARSLVLARYGEGIHEKARQMAEADFKSRLQESIQAAGQATPLYTIVAASGPDHDRLFTAEVSAEGRLLGRGSGKSKKAAEMAAAEDALQKRGEIE
jgi:ribonuclease-3